MPRKKLAVWQDPESVGEWCYIQYVDGHQWGSPGLGVGPALFNVFINDLAKGTECILWAEGKLIGGDSTRDKICILLDCQELHLVTQLSGTWPC